MVLDKQLVLIMNVSRSSPAYVEDLCHGRVRPPLLADMGITDDPASRRRPGREQRGSAVPKRPITRSPSERGERGGEGVVAMHLCSAVASQPNGFKWFVPVCAGSQG